MSRNFLETEIRDALDEIVDPCSCSTGTPVSIIDMGMVVDVDIDGGDVSITVLPTSITCPFFHNIGTEISDSVESISGISEVTVTMDTDRSWSPERMADDARERLASNREATAEEYDITPYAEVEDR